MAVLRKRLPRIRLPFDHVVVWFLDAGDLKSTTPDGKETVNKYAADTVRFAARDRTHTETLVNGKQHAIITELK